MGSKAGNILRNISPLYDAATGGKGIAMKAAIGILAPMAAGSMMGTVAGSPLTGGMMGPTQGSGFLGSLTGGGGGFSTALRGIAQGASNLVGGSSGGGLAGALGGGGGNLLSAAANIYSGIQGNQAVKDMTKAQTAANDKALALQSKMYDQTTANMNPFLTSGQSANTRLSQLLGLGGDPASMQAELESSPGYQFRLNQGTKSMNQSLGARGALFSGDALKAAQTFGQGLADQTYNDRVTQLQSAAGAGQNAAANMGGFNSSYANTAGALYGNQGDIAANGIVSKNNNTNQTLANLIGGKVGGFTGTNGGYAFAGYDESGQPIYRRV